MMYTMKPLTFSEAADCVREANAIASGLRLDEVEAMLRDCRAFLDPDADPPRISNRAMVRMIDRALSVHSQENAK